MDSDRELLATRTPDAAPNNSAAKTLRVLGGVARPEAPHRLGEIAEYANVSKTSTHRILATLLTEGYVVADGEGRYGIGSQLRALAARVLSDDTVGIDAVLRTLQQRLGQAVFLAVLSSDHVTYTHKVEPGRGYRIAAGVGSHVPLHASAAGKALLAFLPEPEVADLLRRTGLPARTVATLTDPAALRMQLDAARQDGYALDREECDEAICSLAAPVLDADDYPVGAVVVSSLTFLLTAEQLRAFAPAVRLAAADVARRL